MTNVAMNHFNACLWLLVSSVCVILVAVGNVGNQMVSGTI